jgi:hypothetical protein
MSTDKNSSGNEALYAVTGLWVQGTERAEMYELEQGLLHYRTLDPPLPNFIPYSGLWHVFCCILS